MFMKKGSLLFGMFVLVMALSFLAVHPVHAAPIVNFPVTVTQPDGTKLNLFASGDEYYNWLADAQGYTVMQDPVSGDYVYADLVGGKLVPTKFVAGRVNPASAGLRPNLNISPVQKTQIRQAFLDQTKKAAGAIKNAPHTGTINNLVVFIRFSGEAEFTTATSFFTNMLNDTTAGANSLRNYYLEVSYNALTVNSTLYPTPGGTVLSYQDGHTRGYYQPYSGTNTGGYSGDTDRRLREHTLLRDAITYINGLGQFPSGASIDGDNDGIVDSLTFIVSGGPTAWSTLLWPHQWSLYTYTVTINGKTIQNYSFHLNDFLASEGTGVLAHEMFHALGAPDLYHYSSDGLAPVGAWDVMENTQNPPQHMGCYMKYKYGLWISSIPVLSATGTYTLNPVTSSTNNCYKIASNSATEYFVVEYRRATGPFEGSLPGTGLLVYRINTLVSEGNRNGPPDEVYIYRPGGTLSVNGSVNTANFSSTVGRTAINNSTNPSSFLSNGSAGGLNLCNIGASNATISFDICGGISHASRITLPLIKMAGSPAQAIVNGDFESGSTSWTEYSYQGYAIILSSSDLPHTPHSGSYAAWLGGVSNEISYIQQQVTIPAGAPYLVYWHWISSTDSCGHDFGGVEVNGSVVDVYNLCSSTNTGGWVKHSVNLSAYAGQSIALQIRAETDSSNTSNLYIDDVSLQASASAGLIDVVTPVLDDSTTQEKTAILMTGEIPQGIVEKRQFHPR